MSLDVAALRREFPALDQSVNGKPLVYLDNAATSQKPQAVLAALDSYYRQDNANVHRGIHELSRRATEAYEEARGKVARWINAPDAAEIVWTRGTTEAINLVAAAWGLDRLGEGDEILLTVMEHHSNLVPWQLLARRTGAQAPLHRDRRRGQTRPRRPLLACSPNARSSSRSTTSPTRWAPSIRWRDLVRAAHDVGALVLVDGAQGARTRPRGRAGARRRLLRVQRPQDVRPHRDRRAVGTPRAPGGHGAVAGRRRDDRVRGAGLEHLGPRAAQVRGGHAQYRRRHRHGGRRGLPVRARPGRRGGARAGPDRLRGRAPERDPRHAHLRARRPPGGARARDPVHHGRRPPARHLHDPGQRRHRRARRPPLRAAGHEALRRFGHRAGLVLSLQHPEEVDRLVQGLEQVRSIFG